MRAHNRIIQRSVAVADLIESIRQRRTFDTAAILSVNDYTALVSPT